MYFHTPIWDAINHAYLIARSSHQGWQQDLWALRTGTYKLVSLYHLDPYLIVSTRQSDRTDQALLCPSRKPRTLDTKSHHLECPFCQNLIGIPTCSSILLHLGEYCPAMHKHHQRTAEADWCSFLQHCNRQVDLQARQAIIQQTQSLMAPNRPSSHNYDARHSSPTMTDTLGFVNPALLHLWITDSKMDCETLILQLQRHKATALMRLIQTLRKRVGAWVSTSLEAC